MTEVRTAPYGTWGSPVTSEAIVGRSVGLSELAVDGADLYWLESRPSEAGRTVLVRRGADGSQSDLTPAPFNVRTRVHEYGGGAYAVGRGLVCFSDFADGRLYRLENDGAPTAITPEGPWRYADLVLDIVRARLLCVREDHGADGEPANDLVAVALDGSGVETLAEGADFYAAPRLSPDGTALAWLSWDHPNMPWDESRLWLAELDEAGRPRKPEPVAGGPGVSVFQPAWSPDGRLHYIDDRSGWWNLYRREGSQEENLHPAEIEFGRPLWQFGMEAYGFLDDGRIACRPVTDGLARLSVLGENGPGRGDLRAPDSPFTWIEALKPFAGRIAAIATGPRTPPCVALVDPDSGALEVLKESSSLALDPADVSVGRPVWFETGHGERAQCFYYPPAKAACRAPEGERPPLIVRSHGGPTSSAHSGLSLAIQYWTSRGFAVADVNYGGSTGFGRAYRQRLDGQWGLVDVEDCINAARHLVAQGLADPERLIIRGSSAGGYTTLCALAFHKVFKAGASLYGIGDLKALTDDTHKFESRYLDRLVGPLPGSEALYEARSPIHFTEELDCPVIFLQGLEDKVVPPNQAEAMVAALRAKGLPVAYLAFEGEGHGFRKAATIKRALEAELYFYGRVFGFTPADVLEPVTIENLDA
jgi:dipeptidyl aminopeptidase/acylaminoacyl peptidase